MLNTYYPPRQINIADLLTSTKWNHLVQNGKTEDTPGFVLLKALAKTKRGIATGANDFFHLPAIEATRLGIETIHQLPCVGRAIDVKGYIFTDADFQSLTNENRRTRLIAFGQRTNEAEARYLRSGEENGLPERYLLSKRTPWHTMETRDPAPIWAAVFSRSELRFICNEANVLNLTTFHGLYPKDRSSAYVRALTAVLNSQIVQEKARASTRVYGGGLLKFEPKDILEVPVPNLDLVTPDLLAALGNALGKLHTNAIKPTDLDHLTLIAANQAAKYPTQLF